jgi:hypothetical protein
MQAALELEQARIARCARSEPARQQPRRPKRRSPPRRRLVNRRRRWRRYRLRSTRRLSRSWSSTRPGGAIDAQVRGER